MFAKVEAAHSRPKKYAEGVRTLSTPGDAVKFLRFDGDTGNFTVCGNARKRGFSLLFSDMGLTQAEFYEFFEFLLYWVLVLYLSFRAGIYGTKTGLFSRKIKFVIFACSFASIAAALRRRTFFACTKKVPKKYPEGLRALSTPGDAVKFLRFDGDTANFAVWRKRIKTHFIFTP